MDHTVQLGPHKCLVIAGVRLSAWRRKKAPLEHEDLSLLNLTPMKQSTAAAVAEQLEATRREMGVVPAAILSDEGAELKSGMALFREQSVEARHVPHVFDIKHKVAILLKRELHHDTPWQSFVTHTNRTKLQTTLTELAFLVPPSLRTKARYMNLDTLVDWGTRALAYLDDPRDLPGQTIDRKRLQQKLGWLAEYRSNLVAWAELLSVAKRGELRPQERLPSSRCAGVAEAHAAPGAYAGWPPYAGRDIGVRQGAIAGHPGWKTCVGQQ